MLNQKQFGCLKFLSVKHNWKFKKQKKFLFAKQKFPARQTKSVTPVQIRKIRTMHGPDMGFYGPLVNQSE
jgi:hypothetical protein